MGTAPVGDAAATTDHRGMASLPALPRRLAPISSMRAPAEQPPAVVSDPRLRAARRARAADLARRATSVPPPRRTRP
jgi:hypothetical protein